MKDFLMNRRIRSVTAVIAGSALLASAALAQQYVYPAKGQSAEQQKKDEYECHQWAVNQTGFDPTKAPPPAAAPPPTTGASRGSGARGAARGAVVGEVIADDASTGAAVGAAAARGQSRRDNKAQAQAAGQQQQQASSSQQAGYSKARAACLEGRGYSIK
jgi:hypothetical protein